MTRTIVQSKKILVPLVVALALLLAVACDSDDEEDRAAGNASELLFSAGGSEAIAQLFQSGSSANTGIWVNGTGKATGDPNLGLLSLGVEALADTASEARETAAGAIDAARVAHALTPYSSVRISTASPINRNSRNGAHAARKGG